jgi:holliday junction DNA helicase RuvA
LLTHFVVREDAQLLYGFGTAGEREAFRLLIKIAGVGPRTALSVLSGMSVGDIAQAVTAQESGRLVKVPGIGKKTAERLLLELKGKFGADLGLGTPARPATTRPTSCRRCWRSATATRKPRPR